MRSSSKVIFLVALVAVLLTVSCGIDNVGISKIASSIGTTPTHTALIPTTTATPLKSSNIQEVEILEIPLPQPLNENAMEYSGLAWYHEKLVLLPQYPLRGSENGTGKLNAIEKQALLAYINNPNDQAIKVEEIPFDDGGLSGSLAEFEGFEAIAFFENQVFVTIETHHGSPMMGYLVSGAVEKNLERIELNPSTLFEIPPQTNFVNASDEALTIFDGRIYTFFEDNGARQNPQPEAHVFDLELKSQDIVSYPSIEFRVTDATETSKDGTFWVMNYFYPGDIHLAAEFDPLAAQFGEGPTHASSDRVERILELKFEHGKIVLSQNAPLQLSLQPDGESRNWEGLARLDDLGFLIITDTYPRTIFGFVQDLN